MNAPDVDYSIPTLLGRAGIFNQRKTYQYFAQIRDQAGVFQVPDRNLQPEGWMADYLPVNPGVCGDGLAPRTQKCERLWRVGTGCQVAYRNGAGPFVPLQPKDFDAFGHPGATVAPGSVSGGSGYFRIKYQATTLTGSHVFFLDVGQTVELYALQVNSTIVGPPGSILITDRNSSESTTPATLTGLVIDARLGAVMMPIESPTGLREGIYTQIIPVAINAQVVIPVPKFAVAVKVYQDNVGAASAPWDRFVGVAPVCNVGTLAFAGRASAESDRLLGRESSLRTDINALNARLFQVVWTIRP